MKTDVRFGKLVDLEIMVLVHRREPELRSREFVEHSIERIGELFEIIARDDFTSCVDLSLLDQLGRLTKFTNG